MEVSAEVFKDPQVLNALGSKIQMWMGRREHQAQALYLACEVVEKLKSVSVPVWPAFMPALSNALTDKKDYDIVVAAAYCVNVAAPLPEFNEAAASFFTILAQMCSGKAPRKRDDKAKLAFDNAVAALINLGRQKANLCPP